MPINIVAQSPCLTCALLDDGTRCKIEFSSPQTPVEEMYDACMCRNGCECRQGDCNKPLSSIILNFSFKIELALLKIGNGDNGLFASIIEDDEEFSSIIGSKEVAISLPCEMKGNLLYANYSKQLQNHIGVINL